MKIAGYMVELVAKLELATVIILQIVNELQV
jgi:hypothetical protein